jgi:hypothetical protein
MVLERAPRQRDAVGEQRGRQRVAGMAGVGFSVEGETNDAATVDQAARFEAVRL